MQWKLVQRSSSAMAALVVGGLAVVSGTASAAPVSVPLSSFSGIDITFDGMATDTPIGAQPSVGDGLVATFAGLTANNGNSVAAFGDADTIAANFAPEASPAVIVNPVTISFSSPVLRVGFLAAAAGPDITIEAFRLVSLVPTAQGVLSFAGIGFPNASGFVGVEDMSGIDFIQVSSPNGSQLLAIDDVRIDAIPEPASLGLVAAASLAGMARRRRA